MTVVTDSGRPLNSVTHPPTVRRVRYERLVIEAGSTTFSLAFHPRLTVIAGVGELERESLSGELIGALGSSRSGVHLELVADDGRRLAVFRPATGRHRVVDIDEAADVTNEFLNPDGDVDLFAHAEVDPRAARRTLRTGATDLTTVAASDELVQTLAGLDQTQLWSAAARVRVTDEQLQAEAEATGSAPEDADMIDRIEHSHHMLEATVERQDRLRRKAFLTAGLCAVVGIPSAVLVPSLAIPIIAVGLLVTIAAFGYRARVNRAFDAEREALGEAGAQSYLGFQLQRVNGLVSSQENRRRLLAAAEDHRVAAARWSEIVGDVSVDWALEHHEAITAAARLRDDIHSIGQLSSGSVEVGTDQAAGLAQALVARLVQARNLGTHQESFPVILDDPFTGLPAHVKPALLELLRRTAGTPQAILLTDDEDVASWARLEALAGELTVLEPSRPGSPDAPASSSSSMAS